MRFYRSPRAFVWAGVVFLSAAISGEGIAILRAQSTPGAAGDTTLHAETRLVLVDAVAFDRKNNFARDLTQKDFRIWEDGREQKITSFSLESAGLSPERSNKHYIALFYDSYTVTPASQQRVRQETLRFVDGFASPDRYMAVINYYGAGLQLTQNFTADAARLKGALGTLQGSTAGATATGTGRVAAANEILTHINFLASIGSAAKSLAGIRGRKALILFSAGFDLTTDISDELAKTIDACNKANVGVYSVPIGSGSGASATESGGQTTTTRAGRGGASAAPAGDEAISNENVLRSLSDGTGGLWMPPVTNDLAGALGRVAQEQDEYYLLGYTPAPEPEQGTCHKLRVKVDRSGLDVRSRQGYCASKPADALSASPAAKALEAHLAGGAAGNIAAKLQLPWFYARPNVARVEIAMDIDSSAIKFRKEKGRLHAEIDLLGIAYKRDGTAVARMGDTVMLDFDTQQQADSFAKAPYRYTGRFEIAPGDYSFRMAFSSGEREFGRVEMPLNIGAWNGQVLSVSGLALSRDARPVVDGLLVAGLDHSLLEGPRPLVAQGVEVTPTGTNQFRPGERGLFYFEVYEPRLAPLAGMQQQTPPNVALRIRVLNRATGQQKDDSGPMSAGSHMTSGDPVIPVALGLPLAGLSAGSYTLEVSVTDDKAREALVRTVDFDMK